MRTQPSGQVHDHFHAHGPFALVVALGQTEFLVQAAAYRTHRTVAHNGELRAHVHAGHERAFGLSFLVHALIHEPHARDLAVLDQGLGHGHAGPYLGHARAHGLPGCPGQELAHGEQHARFLAQERRNPG